MSPAAEDGPTFAGLLRTWRERALLTQEQLARQTGLTARTIRRLETHAPRRPRSESVRLLADALRLTDVERAQLAAARDEPRPAGIPRQLPPDTASFVGRVADLGRLDALLGDNGIAVITGSAGVGKTALAVRWAHRIAGAFPDGQLFVNLRGFDPDGMPMEPATAARGFLDAIGVPPQHIPAAPDARMALYRSCLSGKRMLVILDNARDAEQVRGLLPGSPGCLAVVTSRNQLTGLVAVDGARPLAVDLLSVAESRDLLAHRLGTTRVRAEPDAVDEVVACCARLPLALAIAAARAAIRTDITLRDLVRELRAQPSRLDAFSGEDPVADLRSVFSWSYTRLSVSAARLFRLLGLLRAPDITAPAVASLVGAPGWQARSALAELVRANMVIEQAGRFSVHDLLRTYARELTLAHDATSDRRAAIHRVVDHYLHSAYRAARLVNPHRDWLPLEAPQAGVTPERPSASGPLAWFDAEYHALLAAVTHARALGLNVHIGQLAWAMVDFLYRQGHWRDWTATQEAALHAARCDNDLAGQARAHRCLGEALGRLGDTDGARSHLLRALRLYEDLDDDIGQAHTGLKISVLLDREGHSPLALDHGLRAIELYRAVGHRAGLGRALNAVGWYYLRGGDYRQAVTHCRQAITLCREIDDPDGEAAAWDSLGYAHHQHGYLKPAIACFLRAVTLYRQVGSRYYEAEALHHLGDAQHSCGHRDAARDAWQRALTILDLLGHPDAEQLRAKLGVDSR